MTKIQILYLATVPLNVTIVTNMSTSFKEFLTSESLAETLAKDVKSILQSAISDRGHASMVVSGGSTPKAFFKALKCEDIEWDKVYITLADERWVDTTSDLSNEKMVREYLLYDTCNFIGLKNNSITPEEGLQETETRLSKIPRPFDVVVLGMGTDGHIASLFPDYQPSNSVCTAVQADIPRITMTLPTILNSRRIILHITGNEKLETYKKANNLPVCDVINQKKIPIDVYYGTVP